MRGGKQKQEMAGQHGGGWGGQVCSKPPEPAEGLGYGEQRGEPEDACGRRGDVVGGIEKKWVDNGGE